jgi:hypothetical protein
VPHMCRAVARGSSASGSSESTRAVTVSANDSQVLVECRYMRAADGGVACQLRSYPCRTWFLYAPYFERGADLHIMRKSRPIHRNPKDGAFASPYDLHTV